VNIKERLKQVGVVAGFILAIVGITLILRMMHVQQEDERNRDLVSALYNLYFIPILIAAFFSGERWGVVVGLFSTMAVLFVATDGAWVTSDWMLWSTIGIRGCFYLIIAYMAGTMATRVRGNAREWHSLVEVSRAINSSLDLHQTLESITRLSVELTNGDASAIRLVKADSDALYYANTTGLSEKYLNKGPLNIQNSTLMQRALTGAEVVMLDVREATELPYREEMLAEGIIWVLSLPLRVDGNVIGLLNLYHKHYVGFTNRDRRVGRAFAEQAATAIQNARLYDSIRANYLDTVRALTRAIEAKDPTTLGHSERIVETALRMACGLKLPFADREMLEFGAILHDIGKIGLDEQTLAKTGRLTVDERVLMEMHPLIGKSIIDPIEFLRPCIPIVLSHHERWDGSGYPEGLVGTQIPLMARIVAVADALDHEMYRNSPFPLSEVEALETLRNKYPGRFDPTMLDVLAATITPDDLTGSAFACPDEFSETVDA
jgi:HD-GYP domain-containing protein (c-di-GMP phosphodiesterase class II)